VEFAAIGLLDLSLHEAEKTASALFPSICCLCLPLAPRVQVQGQIGQERKEGQKPPEFQAGS
jgi:hypothetical protein